MDTVDLELLQGQLAKDVAVMSEIRSSVDGDSLVEMIRCNLLWEFY